MRSLLKRFVTQLFVGCFGLFLRLLESEKLEGFVYLKSFVHICELYIILKAFLFRRLPFSFINLFLAKNGQVCGRLFRNRKRLVQTSKAF
jgi:hypothetical protein